MIVLGVKKLVDEKLIESIFLGISHADDSCKLIKNLWKETGVRKERRKILSRFLDLDKLWIFVGLETIKTWKGINFWTDKVSKSKDCHFLRLQKIHQIFTPLLF